MEYIDGFVAAVKSDNKQAYIDFSKAAAVLFRDHGALRVVDCWGDDVPDGEVTSFPMAVKLKKGESVIFSWIVWPSKAVRDAGMEKAMSDPRMDEFGAMPFDGKRLIFGGFQMIVDA